MDISYYTDNPSKVRWILTTNNWERTIDIIQTAFRDNRLPVKCDW